ncbi:unnamed protein product [Mesocestoides corti]|uniref:Uncharacterized protein n=1 Tax=Mesocestoides corti TaxID=53468 RepID=A0A158QRY5_MESCO|nr:unnamed protein product [Mesocestoides corti]
MFCFSLSAKRQGRRIRLKLFQQILRQDIGWFDQQTMGDLITKLTSQVDQIETGIGDRLGRFLQNLVMFISCFVSAFNNQWKLALVGLSTTPVIVIAFTILGLGLSRYSTKEDKEYSLANSIASEVLVSIRTVFAFIGQEKEAARYNANLGAAAKVSLKKNLVLGFGVGLISFSIFSSSGLTFWYGIKLITEGDTSVQGGTIVSRSFVVLLMRTPRMPLLVSLTIQVVLAFLVGSIALGLVLPEFAFFTRAASAAKSTFWIIERVTLAFHFYFSFDDRARSQGYNHIPPIDKDQPGEIIENFKGRIEFKNVTFRYPTRPTMTTLNNLSIKVRPGQTVAIVGPSGSGKSTTIQLIQRFYNAESGEILIDGKDIRTLDLVWLRKQIGVVQQEPTLFSGTVAENIAFGLPGATEQEIEAAAKMADAHDFILKLPQVLAAYQTSIVEGGGGMSGGQKQRIAIARALIRNPKILLLDEATSALDTRSERAVQMALDRARTGRTVIMVAHRLTTVRDANKIVVMDRGQVMEIGNHDQLVALNGIYAHMLSTQDKPDSESDTERESDEEGNIDQSLGMSKEEMRKRNVWMRSKRYSEVESVLETLSETSSSIKTSKEKNVLLRAVKLNRPEFPFLFAGLFFSLLSGLSQPGFSILYSQMFGIFSMNNTAQEKLNETSFYSGMMALLGFLQFVVQVLSGGALGYAGSRLIKRARSLLFSALLRQEIGWFDRVENSPGILTARLATEVSCLETVTGVQLGTLMEAISLITASLVIGFVNSWALSLVNLCFAPILVISSALQMNHLKASIGRHEVAGSQVVQEALSAEKTVTSFGLESHFYEKFRKRSAPAPSARYKEALMFAVVHSIASSLLYYQAGSTFYVGAVLLSKGQLTTLAIFRSFAAFNFGSQALGRVASLAPGFKKASHDVRLVFATMDRKTKSDVNAGDFPDEPFDGRIEFRNVYFRYPTRPNTRILRRFSHTVEAGQSVALVGQSGCGKSTLLQLVQRLYDASNHGPDSGIFMNGRDVRTLAPNWIRKQIGIVSQEPNLFDLTIRENIAYGDNSREVSMEEIIAAAKKANAHSFIETLPEGYETNVGQGGSQLSGGQKQRVAIARAIIREPRILLLDEATSALDNESERVVQAALDAAMAGGNRTSLVVAHRLTTVENCDMIVVLQEGQKVESGPPSALCGLAVGCSFPVNLLIFSDVVNAFTNTTASPIDVMPRVVGNFALLGSVTFIVAAIQMFCFSLSARRQSRRIRLMLFKQILRQDVPWFDRQALGDIITKLTSNVDNIETGIGERLGRFLQNFALFISCFVSAFTNNWKIALVGLSSAPLIVLAFFVMGFTLSNFAIKEQKAYSIANNVASEVFSSIKTVFAFIGQEKEKQRYRSQLGSAAKVSFKKNVMLGFGIGLIGGSIFGSSGLTFWFGVKQMVESGSPDSGTIVSVVLAFLVGSIALGLVLPEFSYFTRAKAAASGTFYIIERIPEIDKDEQGMELENMQGNIEFRNVTFSYPMRPDIVTLKNFSMKIKAGQTIAIVGPSGSGKSTVIQLLQRFYDPSEGQILIDGHDIRELDIKWMRRQFGVVSQEPVLFAGTIEENINLGREDATFEEIENAAKLADAHDFIIALQDAYETMIGEGGGGMSGGQKQRLAIARALIRNPKIMLLDEATSALDTHSERAVQEALDKAGKGRTVIMVAHRLTTVRNADKIIVVDRGVVKEVGSHDELVKLDGIYAHMLSTQVSVGCLNCPKKKKDHDDSDSEPQSDAEPDAPAFTHEKKRGVWRRTKPVSETESVFTCASSESSIASTSQNTVLWRAFKLNKPEFPVLFIGLIVSLISGLIQPGFSILYSQMFEVSKLVIFSQEDKLKPTEFVAGMMALLGLVRLITQLVSEPGWFDQVANQPGVLTARLATEVSSLETVTGAQLGSMMEAVCLLVASMVIAFAYSWQLTLVNICFLPVIVMKNFRAAQNIREVAGSQVVQESLSAERTVFSLGLEDHFYNKFVEKSGPTKKTFSAFNFGSQGLTRIAALAPEFKKATTKICSVFATVDRETKLDVTEGEYPDKPLSGSIVFKNVYFRYPTRRHVKVLRRFNYHVHAGDSVALVGASGCGKSTLLQLVQRLYDVTPHGPNSGIFMDGKDVRSLAPNWIRQQIGIVSQEPNLFDLTIRENIAYGDNSREVSLEEIIAAAKDANVHDFVQSLPQGYETPVGARGSQLSGGQKQRIAIARALIRKPKFLLLDEATSALDNESERIVQAALDKAMAKSGCTSLVVAHRLTTVENCDVIVVLEDGQESEIGSPEALMEAKGVYYRMHNVDAAVKRH